MTPSKVILFPPPCSQCPVWGNFAYTSFTRDVDTAVEDGNRVWGGWWGSDVDSIGVPFNTGCFCNVNICADER
ncbi:unnamed protein product [Choristocarpus tenellus]